MENPGSRVCSQLEILISWCSLRQHDRFQFQKVPYYLSLRISTGTPRLSGSDLPEARMALTGGSREAVSARVRGWLFVRRGAWAYPPVRRLPLLAAPHSLPSTRFPFLHLSLLPKTLPSSFLLPPPPRQCLSPCSCLCLSKWQPKLRTT